MSNSCRSSGMRMLTCRSLVVTLLAGPVLNPPALARDPVAKPVAPPSETLQLRKASEVPAPADATRPLTGPAEHAQRAGIQRCLMVIESAARRLVRDNEHGAISSWSPQDADRRLFNSQIVIRYADQPVVAILTVSPVPGARCDGVATAVNYIDMPCAQARQTLFADWRFAGELADTWVLETADQRTMKTLVTAGRGCNAITHEVMDR